MKTKTLNTISMSAWLNPNHSAPGSIITHRLNQDGKTEVHFYYNFSRASVTRALLAQARHFNQSMAVRA